MREIHYLFRLKQWNESTQEKYFLSFFTLIHKKALFLYSYLYFLKIKLS